MRRSTIVLLGSVVIGAAAYAGIRIPFSDSEAVARAELIVVGRIHEDSIRLMTEDIPEHHMVLRIDSFLKGTNDQRTIEVCMGQGLIPTVGGYYSNQFLRIDKRWSGLYSGDAKDIIEVVKTPGSRVDLNPITGDIRTNHVWLLRSMNVIGSHTWSCGSNLYSVFDPEDIQPISKTRDLIKLVNDHARPLTTQPNQPLQPPRPGLDVSND